MLELSEKATKQQEDQVNLVLADLNGESEHLLAAILGHLTLYRRRNHKMNTTNN